MRLPCAVAPLLALLVAACGSPSTTVATSGGPAPTAPQATPATVAVQGSLDNTLYESAVTPISDGRGQYLFVGKTGGGRARRALLRFELTGSLPPGARVQSVTLALNASRAANAEPREVRLHRALAAWGEGTSDSAANEGGGAAATPGDATWLFRLFDSERWQAAGGDYVAAASGSLTVAGVGPYEWPSTPGLVADVQAWLADPARNHGWVLVGDESATRTTKRFDSREHPLEANRPVLRITFVR